MEDNHQAEKSGSSNLNEGEQSQADAHSAPRALVIHEIVREEGENALERTFAGLAWSGLAAGLSMGFSFLAQALLHAGLPDAPWRHLVDSFGYSIGFILVILGKQQLFTESTLTAVLPVLTRKDGGTLAACLRLWAIVIVANLVGTWIFAALITPEGLFEPDTVSALKQLSSSPTEASFGITCLKAVLAGWLIALMVWILPSARSARLLTVLIITYVVALGRLTHSIAGSVEAAYAVLGGGSGLGDYCARFLVPTVLGNILGGVALVALLNHASVAPEIDDPD